MTRAAVTTSWPAAVSPLMAAEVAAAPRDARVLAAFPTALYLLLDRHELVLPVLAQDALQLPTGLRLAEPSWMAHWGVGPGDTVLVGDGRVRLPARDVVAVRQWRPPRLPDRPAGRVGPVCAAVLRRDEVSPVLRELSADLVDAALRRGGVGRRVNALVGAGAGLTPSGDDALCGVLLGLRATAGGIPERLSAVDTVARAVREAASATTSLSASLLHAAAQGYAVPEVVRLVGAIARGDARDAELALPPVLAIGHTSGADLAAGLAGALDALDTRDALAGRAPHVPATPRPHSEGARRA